MNCASNYCRFDSALNNQGLKKIWDLTILENENFITIPSLGSIVPGWLMVIPKQHYLNMLEVEDRIGLMEIVSETKQVLKASFGAATVFEHGAVTEHSAIGCGIDHAHLHIVSLPFSLASAISSYQDVRYMWQAIPDTYPVFEMYPKTAYLYYQEPGKQSYMSLTRFPKSQYFRRVIAAAVGRVGEFDYRKYSFESNVRFTIGQVNQSRCAYA